MNKILIAFFLLIIICSCKKDNPDPQVLVTNVSSRISGISPSSVATNNVLIFPNPSESGIVAVNITTAASTNCTITVLAGKKSSVVYNENLSANSNIFIQLSLSKYLSGVVLFQVVMDSKMWEYNLIIGK